MTPTDILLPALAMGLGWGIRGQFGHESGAMVPGAMVGLALALLSGADPPVAMRLGALGALGCAVGGCMTYGHTVGLVMDRPRQPTMRWGELGLAVKGAAWIGVTGGLIATARWDALSAARMMVVAAVAAALGIACINRPHEPPRLPRIFFSKRDDPKPRAESWGGLWLALLTMLAVAAVRRDGPALALMLCGAAGGGLGFAVGGLLQYAGRHHRPLGAWGRGNVDWWKVMECSFGALAGAGLAVGWSVGGGIGSGPAMPGALELPLLALWLAWLLAAELVVPWANKLWEYPFVALLLPVPLVLAGRFTPWVLLGPVLIWLSGDNLVRGAVAEGLAGPRGAWRILAGVTLVAGAIAAAHAGDGARWWLLWITWTQTLLTVWWCTLRRPWREAAGWRARLASLGGGLWTELAFVAAAVGITRLL